MNIRTNPDIPAMPMRFPSPPRSVRPRWGSIGGPNFHYFLHVLFFSVFPLLAFLWLSFEFAWCAFGTTVNGRFSYYLLVDNAGGPPRDQMQVDYHLGRDTLTVPTTLNTNDLRKLGMPDFLKVVPGTPLVTADVPVRVLQVGSYRHAVPLFPGTWVWKRLLLPLAATAISWAALIILHGEMFRTLRRSYRLLKFGQETSGRLTGTHETGWWVSSDDYPLTYIRRCYVDYTFIGPDSREHRGSQLVLGAADPARWAEGHRVTILHAADDINVHVMYEACGLKACELPQNP